MSGSDDIGHREAWELIPWLVNGRAEAADQQRAERHLASCAACRDELAFQRHLHAALAQDPAVVDDPHPGLQDLLARIDADERAAPTHRHWPARSLLRGLLAAVLIEALGIVALSTAVWSQNAAQARYRTLTTPAAAMSAATIRVVLTPALRLSELQALLAQTQLQIVGGPSAAGVYSLAPLAGAVVPPAAAALAQLRAHPGVRFAEPVVTIGAPQ